MLCQAVYRCEQILLPLQGELVQTGWKVILNGLVSSRGLEERFTVFTSTSAVENVIRAQWLVHTLCGSKSQLVCAASSKAISLFLSPALLPEEGNEMSENTVTGPAVFGGRAILFAHHPAG